MAKKENVIMVERESFEFKEKTCYSYFIKGVIRGKEVKISVMPSDRGGFVVLDIVFDTDSKAELVLTPYEIKDEKTGTVVKGNTFTVRSVDENGEVYECPIKPSKQSDKALLNMLLR